MIFFKSLLIFLALQVLPIAAQAFTFEGISESDQAELLKRFPALNFKQPALSEIDQAIKFLAALETYSNIESHSENNEIVLKATQLKRVAEVQVTGNSEFDDDEVIMALGLKPGTRFDSGRVIQAGERLKEFYGRAGYFNAVVSFGFVDLEKNDIRINVKIRERLPCTIKSIQIETNNNNLRTQLERKVKKHLKDKFTEENINEIETTLNEFLKDKRYLNAQVLQNEARYNNSRTEAVLVYQLTDPFQYEFILNGQRSFNSSKILKEADPASIPTGSADLGQDIVQKIRAFYLSSGFPNVKLSYEEKIKENHIKQIHVELDEGPKATIKKIEVVGRISKPSNYYSEFIFENSPVAIQDRLFVRDDLDLGYKNLITHLNNEGFVRAKIQSSRVEFNTEKTETTITVVLDEGPLTQISGIEFRGIQSFSEKQLSRIIKIESKKPLRLNLLDESIQNIKSFYHERGFIEMRLNNETLPEGNIDFKPLVDYDDKNLNARILFDITEGPQVYVKNVVIDGNSFTKDSVILKEAGLSAGDLVTPELIDETEKRLEKLSIFSRVEVKTLEANTNVSQRTIVISVLEKNPGLFKLGAGVTNKRDLTARGFAGLSYNNIGGKARAVSLRGTIENSLVKENFLEYEVNVAYLEPFIFDRRLRGRASYTRSEKIISNDEYVNATDEIKFTVEKDLTSKIKFTWLVWGFDSVEKFELPESGPLKRKSRQEIAYVGPTLDIDYRDNPFLPSKGFYTKLDAEYAAPELGSSDKIQFVRTQGTFTHYLQLGRPSVVWANSFRTGYEKNISNETGSGVPESFAFFLGGYSTIRGYSGFGNDRIPGKNEFSIDEDDQLVIPNESSYYLVKSEVRFPLWTEPLGGVVFYDAGQVNIQGFEFEQPFRQSVGVGFRINTPVGPFSVDYGIKLNPINDQDKYELHVSIGTF